MELICPVCGGVLERMAGVCRCRSGHCFDIARQGYINLLPVQQKHSRNPGDTREQVLSRRAFLEAGYYAPIARTLLDTAKNLGISGEILDVGCGEGWYSAQIAAGLQASLTGLDISKEAVRCAAARYKGATWLTATAAHIPVAEASADLVLSLFSVTLPEEFARVLKPRGYFFQVLAAQDHLLSLKSIIYPKLTMKEKDSQPDLPGFERVESIPIRFSFTVEGAQVENLLSMTPHVFRIGREGA